MKTIFSDKHALQSVETEFYRGKWVEAFEIPRRAELVLAEVKRANLGPVIAPESFGLAPVLATHDADFVHSCEDNGQASTVDNCDHARPPRRLRFVLRRREDLLSGGKSQNWLAGQIECCCWQGDQCKGSSKS